MPYTHQSRTTCVNGLNGDHHANHDITDQKFVRNPIQGVAAEVSEYLSREDTKPDARQAESDGCCSKSVIEGHVKWSGGHGKRPKRGETEATRLSQEWFFFQWQARKIVG